MDTFNMMIRPARKEVKVNEFRNNLPSALALELDYYFSDTHSPSTTLCKWLYIRHQVHGTAPKYSWNEIIVELNLHHHQSPSGCEMFVSIILRCEQLSGEPQMWRNDENGSMMKAGVHGIHKNVIIMKHVFTALVIMKCGKKQHSKYDSFCTHAFPHVAWEPIAQRGRGRTNMKMNFNEWAKGQQQDLFFACASRLRSNPKLFSNPLQASI